MLILKSMDLPYHLPLFIPLSSEAKSVLIASLLIIIYCLLQWKKKTNTKAKQPPQPSDSWPIIGHLHLLKGLPHVALGKLADQYGPIFMVRLGVRRALVVSSADMAKQCLAGVNDTVFVNRPWKIHVEHLFYNSAMFGFSPYGQYWREMRKITTLELLSNQRVERFKSIRISQVRLAINKILAIGSEPLDMRVWFSDLSLNTIVKLVSGKSLEEWYQGEEYNQRKRLFMDFFELVGKFVIGDSLPALRWFDIGGYEKKMKEHAKEIDLVAQEWLEKHKRRRRSSNKAQEDWAFIDVLLDLFQKEQEKPSKFDQDTIIKATSMFMILAAADTTSVTLTWTLSLLLNNKDALKKTQAELDAVVGKERLVDESDLKNLVYLQSVLKESMRLYPAGPLSVPRESITDCTVNGYNIPAGTQLFVNLYKMHRDPQVWKDPLSFNPERFLLNSSKNYDTRGQNQEYMPFGSGRRMCPGISYAHSSLEFTLANLLHGFDISISSGETIDMTEGFGLTNQKATPLEVILTHRLARHLYNNTTISFK